MVKGRAGRFYDLFWKLRPLVQVEAQGNSTPTSTALSNNNMLGNKERKCMGTAV